MPWLMWFHLVARAAHFQRPFEVEQIADWLWTRLKVAFPETLGAVLMPNHLHLITPLHDPIQGHRQLASLMSSLSIHKTLPRSQWELVPCPQQISNSAHLKRQLRYVALNPCRSKLTQDPISWRWSTYRGLFGAAVSPWIKPPRLIKALGWEKNNFIEAFHAYVSADPSANVNGTTIPSGGREVPRIPLDWIARAACAATESRAFTLRRRMKTRRLFLLLATMGGWSDHRTLASAIGTTPKAVRKLSNTFFSTQWDEAAVRAGILCLSDQRLTANYPIPTLSAPRIGVRTAESL